jgi:hypothetical protein
VEVRVPASQHGRGVDDSNSSAMPPMMPSGNGGASAAVNTSSHRKLVVKVYNAQEYHHLFREEQRAKSGVIRIVVAAFIFASILVLLAMWVQLCPGYDFTRIKTCTEAATSQDCPWQNTKLALTILAYVYYLGMFTIFGTALLFVRKLYSDQVALVERVTELAQRGVNDFANQDTLSAAVLNESSSDDEDADEGWDDVTNDFDGGDADPPPTVAARAPQPPHPLPAVESHRFSPKNAEGGTSYGAVRPLETAALPVRSANALASPQRSRFNPFNLSHLNAWNAMRQVTVDEIANGDSVLNSMFGPTMVLTVIGVFGFVVYFLLQLYNSRKQPKILQVKQPNSEEGNPDFIFGTVGVTLASALILFIAYDFAVVYHLTRACRTAFKKQFLAVTQLEYAVTKRLYGVAFDRSQGYQSRLEEIDGKQVKPSELEDLYARVSSLQAFLEAFQPRPRLLAIDSRFVKYAFLYFFLATALALSVALVVPQ